MDETAKTMMGFAEDGFYCSQIMVKMGLNHLGHPNPELVGAMEALKGGMAFAGKTCGALTGGAGLIGLFAGRGSVGDEPNPAMDRMVLELVDWFETNVGKKHGGIDCEAITGGDYNEQTKDVCKIVVYTTYKKAEEILRANGFMTVPAAARSAAG